MEEDKKEIETLEVTGTMDPIVEKKEEPANPEANEEKVESLIEPAEAPKKEETKELPVDPEVVSDEVVLGEGDDAKVEPEENVVAPPVIVETDDPTAPAAAPAVEDEPKVEEPTAVSEAPSKEDVVEPTEPKAETPTEEKKEEVKEEQPKKKSKLGLILILLILFAAGGFALWYFVLGGNGNKSVKEEPEKKTEVTKKEEKKSSYRLSGNGFEDFDLAFLSLEGKKQNRVYSPLSIKYMLAMLNEGTEGDSHEEIKAVIGDYVGKKYTNSSNMSLANALFIRDTFTGVKDTYKKTLEDKYGAEIVLDSFSTVDNLNKWIENKTLGLLKNAVEEGEQDDIIFWIVNALAIDMEWDVAFDEQPTGYTPLVTYNTMSFGWTADGQPHTGKFENVSSEIATMDIAASFNNYDLVKTVGEENYRKKLTDYFVTCYNNYDETKTYTESDVQKEVDAVVTNVNSNYGREDKSTEFMLYTDDNVKVFAKNLKEYNGTTLQYVAFMPTSGELSEFVEKTNSAKLTEYINELKTLKKENFKSGVITKIKGSIPRFKYEDSLDLMKDLNSLGIKEVFTAGKANLSKLTDDKSVFIAKALHKANIEFTEKGIKASAVTLGGGAGNLAGPCSYTEKDFPVEEIDMTFDKPYLYIIRDKDTGEIWFTGTVYSPQLYSDLTIH